jgi:hypothetical protein
MNIGSDQSQSNFHSHLNLKNVVGHPRQPVSVDAGLSVLTAEFIHC